ncbi:SRPBCC domain-containing protein [Leptospira adleri]|uniref:SRPBCC domain-containing protein n=1 Tax=Leptospira adleri TaxID=2023186 RepID=UPI0010831803|nr:SRPBCC domain-containing protein [Leptospira adleri]TGM58432.1 hypothetical protein EHQ97_08365 [Leptospira adleri]
MNQKNPVTVETADRILILTRIFDAPKNLIFKLWTTPEHVARWWGPNGFTNPICEIDLRPGGNYYYVMRSPEGIDYPIRGTFLEVIPDEKIVYTETLDEHPKEWLESMRNEIGTGEEFASNSVITVTFEKEPVDRTKIKIHTLFRTNEIKGAFLKMGMIEGWSESLDRFDAEVKRTKV